jgi:hypothetical protein
LIVRRKSIHAPGADAPGAFLFSSHVDGCGLQWPGSSFWQAAIPPPINRLYFQRLDLAFPPALNKVAAVFYFLPAYCRHVHQPSTIPMETDNERCLGIRDHARSLNGDVAGSVNPPVY